MTEMPDYHDPKFDPMIDEASRFTKEILGMNPTTDKEHIAVVDDKNSAAVRARYNLLEDQAGGFDAATGDLLYIHAHNPDTPKTSRIQLGSNLVHELVHSGSAKLDEHYFYREALSGMGEYKYLRLLAERGIHKVAADFVLERAGVQVWVPGAMRQVHRDEAHFFDKRKAHSNQGLVAALGMGHSMKASGLQSASLLRSSSLHGAAPYNEMRRSLDTLQPGLAREVERTSASPDGVIQATATIQHYARKRGIVP